MNLLKTYDINKEKHLITEQEGGSTTTAVGTFAGTTGQGIDTLFAGAFHPDFGKIGDLLRKQLEDRFEKREWNDDITPELDVLFKLIDKDSWKDEVEKIVSSLNKRKKELEKFINISDTEMQMVNMNIKYDKITDRKENKKFVSDTNDWKFVYENK